MRKESMDQPSARHVVIYVATRKNTDVMIPTPSHSSIPRTPSS